jgi:Fe-Mn family superoxide dismutase
MVAGHYNHEMFWQCMKPNGEGTPSGKLLTDIEAQFSSVAAFKTQFSDAAKTRFGSGWAWLYVDNQKKLKIGSSPNQDNPLMDVSDIKGFPLLGLDVWEHAYYLKYQNKRADYIENWWKIVNWDYVQKRYAAI